MIVALALASLIAAAPAEELVGEWVVDTERWTFRADGTGSSVDDPKFKYKADGKKLTVTYPEGESESFAYKRQGDKLVMTIDGETLTFAKKGAAPAPTTPAPPAASKKATAATGEALKLVGTWAMEGMEDEGWTFRADGTGVAADPFTWTAVGKNLVLNYPEGPQKMTYALKGETLTITERGESIPLKKIAPKKIAPKKK